MARKKRRQAPSAPTPAPALPPREEPFHAPFKDLKSDWKRVRPEASTPPPPPPPPPLPKPPTPAERAQRAEQEQRRRREAALRLRETEEDLAAFRRAMREVEPIAKDPRGRVGKSRRTDRVPLPSDDELSLAAFQDFVEGRSVFTIQFTDEYMEGAAPGADPYLTQRLHRGRLRRTGAARSARLHGGRGQDASRSLLKPGVRRWPALRAPDSWPR